MHVETECFPFQWHAIAPVLKNGWVLTGEVGKLMPISRQRLAAIEATPNGIALDLIGAPGEVVEMGAAQQAGGSFDAPIYRKVTVGPDGKAQLQLP